MIRVSVGSVSSTPTSSRTSRRRPSSVRSPRSRSPPGVNHDPPSGSGLTRTRTIAPRPSWTSPPASPRRTRCATPRPSRRCRNSRRTSSSRRSKNSKRRVTRNAGRGRKPRDTGSSSEGSPFSARAAERRGNQDRQNRGRVSFDRDLLRVLLDLAPRNALADARPAEAPVPLRRRRDVDRVIEAAPELVPPDRVVLAHASADHEGSRLPRIEDEIRKLRLVPKLVDRERLVLLPEGPQLVADRAVEDRGYVDGDLVLPGPP